MSLLNETICPISSNFNNSLTIITYNPLARNRSNFIKLPISANEYNDYDIINEFNGEYITYDIINDYFKPLTKVIWFNINTPAFGISTYKILKKKKKKKKLNLY